MWEFCVTIQLSLFADRSEYTVRDLDSSVSSFETRQVAKLRYAIRRIPWLRLAATMNEWRHRE